MDASIMEVGQVFNVFNLSGQDEILSYDTTRNDAPVLRVRDGIAFSPQVARLLGLDPVFTERRIPNALANPLTIVWLIDEVAVRRVQIAVATFNDRGVVERALAFFTILHVTCPFPGAAFIVRE